MIFAIEIIDSASIYEINSYSIYYNLLIYKI